MAYLSKLAEGLIPYTAGEQPKDRRFIKLNTNENPYPPSPRVAEAIREAEGRLRLYPDMEATALREAIAQVDGLKPEQVFCGNGSDEVLAFSFAAFFAGKTLTAPDITYSFYPVYAQLFGVNYETVPLQEDYTVDVPGLMRNGPVVLANPNAPTGLLLPLVEVRRLAAHTLARDEVLLVDEAYAEFSPVNALPLLAEFPNLLIVRTFSKSYGLAGLRVGYALGSPELMNGLRRVRDSFNSYPLDCLAQAAARAAVLDQDYVKGTLNRVIAARDWTRDTLRAAGIPVLTSGTNFLFVRADPEDAGEIQKRLRAEGILVRHFTAPRLKAWLRVSVGTQAEMESVAAALIRLISPGNQQTEQE